MRLARIALLFAAATLAPSLARAQNTGGTSCTGTTADNMFGLTKDDFEITLWRLDGKPEDKKWVVLNDYDLKTFFNRARCECKTPVRIRALAKTTGRAKISTHQADVRLRVGGATCATAMGSTPMPYCTDIANSMQTDVAVLVTPGLTVENTADVLFAKQTAPLPGDKSSVCDQASISQSVWLWVDVNNDHAADITDAKIDFTADGQAPPAPQDFRVRAGQEALEVEWTVATPAPDLQSFIVFCSRGGDTPVFAPGSFTPAYASVGSTCPQSIASPSTTNTTTTTTTTTTMALGALAPLADEVPLTGQRGASPLQFRVLDPRFACSNLLARTQNSYRIKILQNGIPYLVGVAAVDKTGNASPIEEVLLQVPVPTRDFYRGYRADGGAAEGGCALGRRAGAGRYLLVAALPLVALLLRRRRRPRS